MSRGKHFTVEDLGLPGVLSITPKVFPDARGLSTLSHLTEEFKALGIDTNFVQEFTSYSKRNVIRGLHFQRAPHEQAKLVRCSHGKIFDVVADHNPHSPTYGQHIVLMLDGESQIVLYIPGTYAHGFCVVSEEAVVEYKLSDIYHPELAGGVRYDDPVFNITWPITNPALSEQDKSWPLLPHRT